MKTQITGKVSRLRAARQKAGLTIDVLAVKAGISRITLYTAEHAPQLMTERTAKAVAKALGVPVKSIVPQN